MLTCAWSFLRRYAGRTGYSAPPVRAQHSYIKTRRIWKCKDCGRQFSVKLGTVFEDSPIPLDKWLCAVWLVVNCKNGISSYEIARYLKITQKSAWFMLGRIRLALKDGDWSTKIGSEDGGESKSTKPSSAARSTTCTRDAVLPSSVPTANFAAANAITAILARPQCRGCWTASRAKSAQPWSRTSGARPCKPKCSTTSKYGSRIYTDNAVAYEHLHLALHP